MKKTAIALVVAGLAAASVAQAAPQENTFYAGVKAGQASFHDGIREHAPGYHRNSFTYGVFGGYQILNQDNLGLAVELGYDDFGRVKYRSDAQPLGKHTAHGAHLTVKGSYDVGSLVGLNGLDFYGRAGVALVRSDLKITKAAYAANPQENATFDGKRKQHNLHVSPVFAAGLEYAILPELAARLEYQWVNKVGRFNDEDGHRVNYSPWIGSINAGIS